MKLGTLGLLLLLVGSTPGLSEGRANSSDYATKVETRCGKAFSTSNAQYGNCIRSEVIAEKKKLSKQFEEKICRSDYDHFLDYFGNTMGSTPDASRAITCGEEMIQGSLDCLVNNLDGVHADLRSAWGDQQNRTDFFVHKAMSAEEAKGTPKETIYATPTAQLGTEGVKAWASEQEARYQCAQEASGEAGQPYTSAGCQSLNNMAVIQMKAGGMSASSKDRNLSFSILYPAFKDECRGQQAQTLDCFEKVAKTQLKHLNQFKREADALVEVSDRAQALVELCRGVKDGACKDSFTKISCKYVTLTKSLKQDARRESDRVKSDAKQTYIEMQPEEKIRGTVAKPAH